MFVFLYFIFIKIRIFLFLLYKSIYKRDLNLFVSIIPFMHLLIKPKIDENNPAILLIKYENKEAKKFLATYDSEDNNEPFPGSLKYNVSMDEIFYRPKELLDFLKTPNNNLENKWKKKILIENTPRGNIIMFYDVYKNGFSYYSDQTYVPYTLLNAVAMKYVRIYLCRDLFIDDKNIPKNTKAYISPLVEIYKGTVLGADVAVVSGGEKEKNNSRNNSSVFLKKKTPLESYLSSKFQKKNDSYFQNLFGRGGVGGGGENTTEPPIYNTNRFLFQGKVCNFSIIDKPKPKKKLFLTKSLLFNDLFAEQTEDLRIDCDLANSNSKENMKYNDFIKKRKESENREFHSF